MNLTSFLKSLNSLGVPGLKFRQYLLSKTYQQIQKLSNFGVKVCLTTEELEMFGYQACHVCIQLEHVFLSHVHA